MTEEIELDKILESKVQVEIDEAIKQLQKENMAAFLLRTSNMNAHIDFHIIRNCTMGNIEANTECIKKANNIRVKSLNKLAELLVEKYGGKMIYLKEE